MSTFLTADTHFGHALMLTACARPYSSVAEMNEDMADGWNDVVHPKDTVWHLGDFALGCSDREVAQIFHSLNGRKHLILGNHDVDRKGDILPALARLPWELISHHAEIKHDGQRIQLSHYAGLTWNAEHHGAYQAYGHSHGYLLGLPGSIDVGVDAQGLRPISVTEFVRQADESIKNSDNIIEQIVEKLRAKVPLYRERDGAVKYRDRQAKADDIERRKGRTK